GTSSHSERSPEAWEFPTPGWEPVLPRDGSPRPPPTRKDQESLRSLAVRGSGPLRERGCPGETRPATPRPCGGLGRTPVALSRLGGLPPDLSRYRRARSPSPCPPGEPPAPFL